VLCIQIAYEEWTRINAVLITCSEAPVLTHSSTIIAAKKTGLNRRSNYTQPLITNRRRNSGTYRYEQHTILRHNCNTWRRTITNWSPFTISASTSSSPITQTKWTSIKLAYATTKHPCKHNSSMIPINSADDNVQMCLVLLLFLLSLQTFSLKLFFYTSISIVSWHLSLVPLCTLQSSPQIWPQ